GIPNGNIVYQLEKNSYGMNLIGNPYPSKIKSTDFYNQNSSRIASDIYFWDNRNNTQIAQQGSNYSGNNYATLNAFTGIGIAAPGTAGMPQRIPTTYINPGTAFIVEALNSGPLYFTNTQRIGTGSAPDFFGRAGEIEEEETEKDVYWLILKSPEGMETMTAVAYFEGGNNDFSVDDSEAFETSDEIYSLLGDKQLVIQGKAAFKVNDRILLGMRLFNPGKHIIQLYDTQGIFSESQPIYLRDKKTKTIHNLSEKPYKFANEAGEINNRFEIIYRKPILDPIATVFARVEITQANKEIIVQSTQEQIIQVELFDLNGKSLYKVDSNALEVRIPTQNTKKQILIVTVKTASGEIISKKLIH
ncbi:MAG: T9SS sorting signal type C domain-containing protein, partial [Weeksellaceae bacterium]|nr:T9SS sorting signal type C domain-containing protein [Weeksellaceae bacterium]